MARRKTAAVEQGLLPMPPQFRARVFTDAGGKCRFGISLAVNGSRFAGSVPMRADRCADPAGVAQLLETLAVLVRRG